MDLNYTYEMEKTPKENLENIVKLMYPNIDWSIDEFLTRIKIVFCGNNWSSFNQGNSFQSYLFRDARTNFYSAEPQRRRDIFLKFEGRKEYGTYGSKKIKINIPYVGFDAAVEEGRRLRSRTDHYTYFSSPRATDYLGSNIYLGDRFSFKTDHYPIMFDDSFSVTCTLTRGQFTRRMKELNTPNWYASVNAWQTRIVPTLELPDDFYLRLGQRIAKIYNVHPAVQPKMFGTEDDPYKYIREAFLAQGSTVANLNRINTTYLGAKGVSSRQMQEMNYVYSYNVVGEEEKACYFFINFNTLVRDSLFKETSNPLFGLLFFQQPMFGADETLVLKVKF